MSAIMRCPLAVWIVLTEEGHPVRGICLSPGSVTGSRGTAGSRYIFAAVLIVPI